MKKLNSDKTLKFITTSEVTHSNKYDYSSVEYVNYKTPVEIICPQHGSFLQLPGVHAKGHGCQKCGRLSYSNTRTRTTEEFIATANQVHKNKFDYTRCIYNSDKRKLTITCKNHGDFLQTANNHLQGNQCPRCSAEDRAEKQHWDYIERCKLNPNLASSSGTLYLLEMNYGDEKFLKVGISSKIYKRLSSYRVAGFSVEVLFKIESTTLQTALWENLILKSIREQDFQYTPNVSFKGWTECARIEHKSNIIKLFQDLK